MNQTDWQKIKLIFNAAVSAKPEAREDIVEHECAGNPDLRREVEALLRSDESDFIERVGLATNDCSSVELLSGTYIDRFEIVELIGAGGMGKVYLAKDDKLERKVAIKIINENYEDDGDGLRRFIQEAKAASALNHPNILTVYEFGETGGSHYIVSEYIDGRTLRDMLREGGFDISQALNTAIQVAEALATAHSARIIHRDIKPENIIIRRDGYVKVLDFGLAKLIPEPNSLIGLQDEIEKQNQTAKGLILGTVKYMSPEQAKGTGVDHRTDIFSVGVLLYEMITGRTPFAGETNSESFANLINKEPDPLARFAADIPDALQRIISKTLQKAPDDRYQTMGDALADVKELKENLSAHLKNILSPMVLEGTTAISSSKPVSGERPHTAEMRDAFGGRINRLLSIKFLTVAVILVAAAVIFGLLYLQPKAKGVEDYTGSPAYDHYLRGRVNAGSENQDNNERSIQLLEQAVAIDPGLAPAYAELARAYNVKAFYLASNDQRRKLTEDAQVAVEKALTLNPDLAQGHFARGLIMWTHGNRFPHDQVIRSYQRALALDPNLDEAHHQLGLVYLHIGLFDKAAQEVEKAVSINPGNTMARYRLGVIAMYRADYGKALEIYNSTPLDKNPSLWAFQEATALFQVGRAGEASDVVNDYLNTHSTDPGGTVTSVKAMILAKEGKANEAGKTIQRAIEVGEGFGHFHHTAYNIAAAYALMDRTADAVKWLRNAADDGLPCFPLFENDSSFHNIREAPEFVRFMAEMKLLNEKYKNEFASAP